MSHFKYTETYKHLRLGILLFLVIGSLLVCAAQSSSEAAAAEMLGDIEYQGLLHENAAADLLMLDSFALANNLMRMRMEAQYRLGKVFLLRMESAQARTHLRATANLAEQLDDHEQQGFALDRLGISYVRDDMLDSALLCFQQAMDIYLEHGLEHRSWTPLQGFSRIYQQKGDYENARKYGEEALQSLEGLDEAIAKTIVLNHMLSLAASFERFDDYSRYFEAYLETIDPLDLGTEKQHIAAYFAADTGSADKEQQLLEAIDQLSSTTLSLSLMSAYYDLGRTYADGGRYREAIDTWETGYRIDNRYPGVGYSLAFSKALASICEQSGALKKALFYQHRYFTLSDSLASLANSQMIDELQVKYETTQKEQTIAAQKFELARATREKWLIAIAALLTVLISAGIVVFMRNRLRLQQMSNRQAALEHKMEIERLEQEHKLDALRTMIEGQEEERKRIAFDLHDQLGGLLTKVKLELGRTLKNGKPTLQEADHLETQIDQACSEVRRIAHNMMPHALHRMGLGAAIEDLVTTIRETTDIKVTYQDLSPDGSALAQQQEIAIYRLINELVQNAVRHSRADSLLIQMSRHNGTYALVVEDDGTGFSPDEVRLGLGLRSVASRVQFLNGHYDIDSTPGQGTTITVEFPASGQPAPQ